MLTIATDQRLLIPRLCRRFSQATGWQLRFVPAGDPEDVIASAESPDDELSCWSSEI
jgi:hypothetical protein